MNRPVYPPDRSAVVTLREITKDSVRIFCSLDAGPGQDGLVAPNVVSIAQAYFHEEAWFRGIYANDTPVGFAMVEDWSQTDDAIVHHYRSEPYVSLWRFMIDVRYQKHGFGAQALRLLIAHAATRPGVSTMLLSFVPKENNPEGFYMRLGFTRTGEQDGDELIMKLPIRSHRY